MTRMLYAALFATAQSSAAMMLLMRPLPSASSALSAMMFAFGAIALRVAVRVVAVAGDDAGDVRAVAPVVVLRGAAVDEVDERGDALAAAVGDGQVVVPRRDARVDDRDADAGAGVTVLQRARSWRRRWRRCARFRRSTSRSR